MFESFTIPLTEAYTFITQPPYSGEYSKPEKFLEWVKYAYSHNEILFDNNLLEFINNVDLDYFLDKKKYKDRNCTVVLKDPILFTYILSQKRSDDILAAAACIDFRDDIDRVKFLSTVKFDKINNYRLYTQLILVPSKNKADLMNFILADDESNKLPDFLSIIDKNGHYLKRSAIEKVFSASDVVYRMLIFKPIQKFFIKLIQHARSYEKLDTLYNLSKNVIVNTMFEREVSPDMVVRDESRTKNRASILEKKDDLIDNAYSLMLPHRLKRDLSRDIDNNISYEDTLFKRFKQTYNTPNTELFEQATDYKK